MPYILGNVVQQTGRNSSSPCMDFHVTCENVPEIDGLISHVPPYFFVGVGEGEYHLKVTPATGVGTVVVASAFGDVGGGVYLDVPVA